MKKKKNALIEINKDSFVYTVLGLFVMCCAAFVMFSFKQFEKPKKMIAMTKVSDDAEETEHTVQRRPDPPKPPKEVVLKIVSNDTKVDESKNEFKEQILTAAFATPGASEVKQFKEEPIEPEVFIRVEFMPEFPGGEIALAKFLEDNLIYPVEAEREDIEGIVEVHFIVDERGKVINVNTEPVFGFGMEEEAMRVVKLMPNWKPGRQRNKNVKVQFSMKIGFELKK